METLKKKCNNTPFRTNARRCFPGMFHGLVNIRLVNGSVSYVYNMNRKPKNYYKKCNKANWNASCFIDEETYHLIKFSRFLV